MISVVIPAWNAAAALPATLAAIRAQEPEHEVIVVDAASTDATGELAAREGVKVVRSPRRNRSLARNLGVEVATGEAIAFLDADCVVVPGWLAALAGCLERSDMAAGPVHFNSPPSPGAAARFDALWRVPQERYIEEAGVAGAGNLAMRRAAWERIGGFNVRLHHGEDTDLCVRARAAGLKLAYCPGAAVEHPVATRARDVLRRGFEHGASATRLAQMHGPVAGRRYWNHPGGLLRRGAALRAVGAEPQRDPAVEAVARVDYLGRMAGSLWAEVARRTLR